MAKMFSHPLLTMNPLELMKLWGDLVQAYHGVHGYGGDTAEIYAYRLMPYNPLAHSESVKGESRDRARIDTCALAANCLAALCEEFEDSFGCRIEIDGHRSVKHWLYATNETPYEWRAQVRVIS